jgi:hypothetical protein
MPQNREKALKQKRYGSSTKAVHSTIDPFFRRGNRGLDKIAAVTVPIIITNRITGIVQAESTF